MTPEQALYEYEKDWEQPRCSCGRFMPWDSKPTRRLGAPRQPETHNDPWNWEYRCDRCRAKQKTKILGKEPSE